MESSKSFKNNLFHVFMLFFLVTAARILYDYKSICNDPYNLEKLHNSSASQSVYLYRFYDSVSVDILSIFFIFSVLFLLLVRYNRNNRVLSASVEKGQDEILRKEKFLSGYIQALDSSTILTTTDKEGVIIYVNEQFINLTGYDRQEIIGKTHGLIRHPETENKVFAGMWKTIQAKKVWSGIIKGLRKDKSTFISQVTIVPILDRDDNIVEYLAARTDITALVEGKEELEKFLVTDSLTNLPNRNKLLDDIKKFDGSECTSLALVNIDSFKDINDFYGYDVADTILMQVAHILDKTARKKEINFYKMPSDEFALFSANCHDESVFLQYVQEILVEVIATKLEILGQAININFSTGIAIEKDSVLIKADMALKFAKKLNKDVAVYCDDLNTEKDIAKNIESLNLLKNALQDNRLIPYFQPIYNLKSKKIEKYECLARIMKQDGTLMVPYQFLEVARQAKIYGEITKIIIEKAFEFFKDKEYEFSINISVEDIGTPYIFEFIIESLARFVDPARVVFEILETEEIKNYDLLKEFIKKIKYYGAKIAIDDFGSGYSNFSHILELHVDYLKIDSSLVRNIKSNKNAYLITKTIIDFANSLRMKTIAEYVEDKESVDLLKEMGATYIQGYYIGRPQPYLL